MNTKPDPVNRPSPTYSNRPMYDGPSYATPYYRDQERDEWLGFLDPSRLLRVLRKRWRTMLSATLVTVILGGLYLLKAPRIYEASALVELSSRRPRILTQQAAVIEDPASAQQAETTLNTQLEKFKSLAILPSVLTSYQQKNPGDARSKVEVSAWLERGVNLNLLRRTRLVAITFHDQDPVRAAQACSAFAEGAEAHARSENRTASDAAVAWLEMQIKAQRVELEKADQALSEARQIHRMDALEAERKTLQQGLLQFNQALVELESQMAKEKELLDALQTSDLQPESVGKLPSAIPRAVEIQESHNRWMTAVMERDALLGKFTPQHPEVVSRDQAIALYRTQVQAALGRARATTASNLELFRQQANSLRRSMEKESQRVADLARDIVDREAKLASLQRARNAADLSYQGVLNRIQEARLSADENTATVKLVEDAQMPKNPVRPRPLLIMALALLVGLAGGIGLALVIDHLEDFVEGMQDVEKGAALKVMAVIPHVESGSRRDMALLSQKQPFSEVAEAFSALRSVLDAESYRKQSKVLLIASSLPAEGKTTTSCNLATAFACNGQRTLLVDFDLRRPRILGIFPLPPGGSGLLDYLGGKDLQPEQLVYASGCPNLSIISSRPIKDISPAELMGGSKVKALIDWARAHYDRVIIDGPPLGLVSDSLALGGLTDGVLVMARPAISRKHALRHTVARFRDIGVSFMAAVMTDVSASAFQYRNYDGPYHLYRKQAKEYKADPEPDVQPEGRS